MPGAHVRSPHADTGFVSSTDTNAAGIYSFPGLNLGTYDMKVEAKGFTTAVHKGLQVNISQVLRYDVQMSVGSVSETVTVSATALAVQSDSNVISTLISAEQISEIATQNRNFAALAAIGLGASSLMPDNNTPSSGAGGSSFNLSINGLRQSHNIWLIDGGESDDRGGAGGMQIMPSQDSISQFEVLASNYPPDYGISSGATISLGLKSGTRNFHGSLWEFNRNTVYDANYFLNKQSNQPRPGLNYNIYGFNIGGPVMIPRRLQQRPVRRPSSSGTRSGAASSNPLRRIPTIRWLLPTSRSPASLCTTWLPPLLATQRSSCQALFPTPPFSRSSHRLA